MTARDLLTMCCHTTLSCFQACATCMRARPPHSCLWCPPGLHAGHFELLSKDVGVPLVCFRLKKVVGSDGEFFC